MDDGRLRLPLGIAAVTDRHLPLVVTTFRGTLELEAVHRHNTVATAIIERALRQHLSVVHIVDARGMEMPSAKVRRFWADRINESGATLEIIQGTFIVLDSALVRGALTAIAWMTSGAANRLTYVPTMDAALAAANAILVARGVPPVGAASLRVMR